MRISMIGCFVQHYIVRIWFCLQTC